jgi:peptidoglycan/LPS O-acetylase OafA/YrhL
MSGIALAGLPRALPSGVLTRQLGRIPALDGLRGVLAGIVLADHAAMELHSDALGHAANISVVVFFVLSGLVLTRQWDGDFPRFLLVRFVRLWPVFAICMAGGSLLALRWPEPLEFFFVPYPAYDANIVCPPVWSLFIEAWAAVAMPFIVWSSRGGVLRTLAVMAAMIALTIFWVPRGGALRAFESYLVCFVAGAALYRRSPRSTVLESPLPQWLGRISYSLYLSHWLVLRACVLAFGPMGVLVGVPLSFAVADGLCRAVEQPSIRLSRRLKSATRPQAVLVPG